MPPLGATGAEIGRRRPGPGPAPPERLGRGWRSEGAVIDDDSMVLRWNYPQAGAYLMRVLHDLGQSYRIDARRISVLGHSMGGGGAWAMGGVMSNLWASVSPHAGWYTGLSIAVSPSNLANVPVFLAHGTEDVNCPISVGADGVWPGLQDTGNLNIYYERMEGKSHSGIYNDYINKSNSWLDTCASWCLSYQRGSAPASGEVFDVLETYSVAYDFGWQYVNTPIGRPINYADADSSPSWETPAAASATTLAPDEGVTFTADAEDDDTINGYSGKDQPVFIRWDWEHNTDSTIGGTFWGRSVVHSFPAAGTYTVKALPLDDSGRYTKNGEGAPDWQSLTITVSDQATAPVVSVVAIDDEAVEGGDNGTFRFTRTGSTTEALPLVLGAGGSASLSNDVPSSLLTELSGLSIPAGSDHIDVSVQPVDDSLEEGTEVFGIDIYPGEGYIVGHERSARILIRDNDMDGGASLVSITALTTTIIEGSQEGLLRLTRQGTDGELAIELECYGTATQDLDYLLELTPTIPDGARHIDIAIPAAADGTDEGDETLIVALVAPSDDRYRLANVSYAAFTIRDGEPQRVVSLRITHDGAGLSFNAAMTPDPGPPTTEPDHSLRWPGYDPATNVVIYDFQLLDTNG